MPRPAVAFLLACLASPLLAAERPPWIATSAEILGKNSSRAAIALLADPSNYAEFKAKDPELFLKTFERAAELKDLYDLLSSPTADDNIVRMGLVDRSDCVFCQKSSEIEAWAAREPGLGAAAGKRLEAVYWDWKTLSAPQRQWLSAHDVTPEIWGPLEFGPRRTRLQEWAAKETKVLMSFNPSTWIEFNELNSRFIEVQGVQGRSPDLRDHLDQARVIVQKIDEARIKMAATRDPGLADALKEAQTAATPEARLAALGRIFDASGRSDAAVLAAGPAGKDQSFDDASRRRVAEIIASGAMRETEGTWAGQELRDFYANHPLNVKVGPMSSAAVAVYQDGQMTFNERYLEQYVKSRGRTLGDLAKDPDLAKSLIYAVIPVFVHEATHQRQDVWAQEQGIPIWGGESMESEAVITAGVFMLQKAKNDPSYRRFVEQNKETLHIVREELAKANRLRMDGAEAYGSEVMNTHYPEYLSISGHAWCCIVWHNDIARIVQKELDRRKKLPPAERAALEARNDTTTYATREEFENDIGKWGSAQLRDAVAEQRRLGPLSVEAYVKYSARLKSSEAAADKRLRELDAEPAKTPGEVPPPQK